jgi:hypothetical protein
MPPFVTKRLSDREPEPRGSLPNSDLLNRLTNSALHDRLAVRRGLSVRPVAGCVADAAHLPFRPGANNHAHLPLSDGQATGLKQNRSVPL